MSVHTFSSAYKPYSKRLLLLGSGELGKELLLEAHKWGIETHAVARYEHAPAAQVAHFHYVIDMKDETALRALVEHVKPTYIVPEIESINIEVLQSLENEGYTVVPSAKAVYYTMDRERIRRLAHEKFRLITSNHKFATTYEKFVEAVKDIGFPCIIKPVMSSSGKGQRVMNSPEDVEDAWSYAHTNCRGGCDRVIVEKFVDFDYEVTLMTLRYRDSNGNDTVGFCPPIIHKQKEGDFSESWQTYNILAPRATMECQKIAKLMVDELGGYGIFGVEFFVKESVVYFNEMSPRPHDTAMITLKTQNMSQFELHLRAIMNIPIPKISADMPGVSLPLIVQNHNSAENSDIIQIPTKLFEISDVSTYIFGKPYSYGRRRMGLILYIAPTIGMAIDKLEEIKKMIPDYVP
jgi:phosphoribosylglycinamide formyltransferase 2